jgi:DnaJ-class molecular chaperone
MSTKAPIADKTTSVIPYSTLQGDGSITHLGVTYSITHHAHHSDTPLESCVECGGSGQLYTRKCKTCRGLGQVMRNAPDLHAYQYSSTYSEESKNK